LDVVGVNFHEVASKEGVEVVVVREQDQKSESMRRRQSFAEWSFN
jgi:hypothetical protein